MPKRLENPASTLREFVGLGGQHETILGDAVLRGTLSKRQLKSLATQVYLQEKWPSHIARVYLNLDEVALSDRSLVKYILSIIRAENLGAGSKGVNHTELIRRFARSIGVSEPSLKAARPTPPNQVLMDWCDMSALDRPWLEAFAVHLACESQVRTMKKIALGVQRNYGATAKDAEFWTLHGGPVERKHMSEGLSLLVASIRSDTRPFVIHTYKVTLQLLKDFYDSFIRS